VNDSGELNDQQKSFVQYYTTGLSPQQAAKKAAYSPSYSRKASKLLKHPGIAAAIEENQAALRESHGYGPADAVMEIDRMMKGALGSKTPNHMAAAKLMELKCKIFGFVRERLEVASVDLRGALAAAESRVLTAINMTNCASSPVKPLTLPANGSTRWAPHIAGDDEPEAGSVDGESVS
jgi:phage terminase small subunit